MRVDLQRLWYQPRLYFINYLLLPFAWLFAVIVTLRRWLYRRGIFSVYHFDLPVIVVGNITVGGTGKTPFVIWLTQLLIAQGYRPGIVSRGVGGKKHAQPYRVTTTDVAENVGDETMLLRRHLDCPIVICTDRAAAVKELLAYDQCDIIISDDGLQHYRLHRDIEIVMVDGVRKFGNEQLLPAGPLREKLERLQSADMMVVTEPAAHDHLPKTNLPTMIMTLVPTAFVSMNNSNPPIAITEFPFKTAHAIAAIGHPQRFFTTLKRMGFTIVEHVFPDHYYFKKTDFVFDDDLPVVMTEKDAVKCHELAAEGKAYWYLTVTANIDREKFLSLLNAKLQL